MSKMSYREYINELLEQLEEFEIKDYKNFITKLAVEKNSSTRRGFLDFIERVLDEDAKTYRSLKNDLKIKAENEDLFLVQDVTELYDKIGNGCYEGYWDWDPEYHEERMMGDESWAEEAAELFLRAGNICRNGYYETALKVYEMLFEILENEELPSYCDYESMMGIDLNEQRNLYLRCIYFMSSPEERPYKILKVIEEQSYGVKISFRLTDLINVALGKLSGFDNFLESYIVCLINSSFYFRKELLREAIFLQGGIEGIKEFARNNYEEYPEAYLDWVFKLKESKHPDREIIETCQEALSKVLRENAVRDPIAKILIDAASISNKPDLVMMGIREAIYSNPNIENIVLLIEYGKECHADEEENVLFALERLISLIENNSNEKLTGYYGKNKDSMKVTLHMLYVLSGQVDKSFYMASEEARLQNSAVGWSYGSLLTPYMVVFLFLLLSRENRKYSNTINLLWNKHLEKIYSGNDTIDIQQKYSRIVARVIENSRVSEVNEATYINWCIDIVSKRVHHIVSNQHRGAYDRAAIALIACAEMIANVRGEEDAYELINGIKGRYPRHTRFVKSVNNVLKNAKIPQKFL